MDPVFYCYPKCTTCAKAKKHLDKLGIEVDSYDIKEENPDYEFLKMIYILSNLPIKRLFNTSGDLYKEMNLKDKLPNMTDQAALELLSTNGMLVKRPILLIDQIALVGYKAAEYEALV